jgi:hypothetical protein
MKRFRTYSDALNWIAENEEKMGKMKFRSTQEYRDAYPDIEKLYKLEGGRTPKRNRVEIAICLHV